jgi:hypothetical protein
LLFSLNNRSKSIAGQIVPDTNFNRSGIARAWKVLRFASLLERSSVGKYWQSHWHFRFASR